MVRPIRRNKAAFQAWYSGDEASLELCLTSKNPSEYIYGIQPFVSQNLGFGDHDKKTVSYYQLPGRFFNDVRITCSGKLRPGPKSVLQK